MALSRRETRAVAVLNMMINNISEEEEQIILMLNILNHQEEEEAVTDIMITTMNHQHIRIDGYYEEWLPRYLDYDFYSLFRMTRKTFDALLRALNCVEKEYVGGGEPVPRDKALLMTLSWLGHGETLLKIHERFNVAISTVFFCTEYMLRKLLTLKRKVIKWPDQNEVVKIERDFQDRSGFPGVIGAVDGCNIQFKAPAEQQDSYTDKNKNYSIKLQGIATSDKIFRNSMVGYPGSAHDSRVFRNSQIYLDIEENGGITNYVTNEDHHLIGDKAYPLKTWLMTPFRDTGRLTRQQRRYNLYHSRTRIVIEHTFGLLKSRWRLLQKVNVNSVEKTVYIIAASCILHNFCFINYDFWEDYEAVEHDDDGEVIVNDAPAAAVNKRLQIMNLF